MSRDNNLEPALIHSRLRKTQLKLLERIEQDIFRTRLEIHWNDALRPLTYLYGERSDFTRWQKRWLQTVARRYAKRPVELRLWDQARCSAPDWFQSSRMIAYCCDVERFASSLRGVTDRVPYLKELGVTHLQLQRLLACREQAAGYSVTDFRRVRSGLGGTKDLSTLARSLRRSGLSLGIDVEISHTAREHVWAQRALAGQADYQAFYLLFPDRELPDLYEAALGDVPTSSATGHFTYVEELDRWAWTTFGDHQWDLDYRNPAVFGAMLDVILYLANKGVSLLRFDGVAHLWKRLGTDCRYQPETHYLMQALRALTRVAAPGLLMMAEADAAPEQLAAYLGCGAAADKECELAQHHALATLLWSGLAEGRVRLMTQHLQHPPTISSRAGWVTYASPSDGLLLSMVADERAAAAGLNGSNHRSFLADFYGGKYPGSFAPEAVPRQQSAAPARICGTSASLAGLARALERDDEGDVELSIRRILLLYGIVFAVGGMPMIAMGDELGLLGADRDPEHTLDGRCGEGPVMDWRRAEQRVDPNRVPGRIFRGLQELARARERSYPLHARASTHGVWTHNDAVLGVLRESASGQLLVLGNFSDEQQSVPAARLSEIGLRGPRYDWLHQLVHDEYMDLHLGPYGSAWLERVPPAGSGETVL